MSFTALGDWYPVNAVLFYVLSVCCSPDAFDVFPSVWTLLGYIAVCIALHRIQWDITLQ